LHDVYVNDTTLGVSYYLDTLAGGSSKTYYVEHKLEATPDPFVNHVEVEGYDELDVHYADSSDAEVDVKNQSQDDPYLEYNPSSHDFGTMEPGQTASTTFDIWNSGTGILTYNLSENCGWVTLSTTSGTSVGEHDAIDVMVDISGLSEGETYTCDVMISSNGGNDTFVVSVTVNSSNGSGNRSPVVSIVEPQCKIYFMGRAFVYFPRPLFIGGPVEIRVNASDPDGTVTYVEFYVGDVLLGNVSSEPYCYNWDERAFGFREVRVVAYDDGGSAEDSINIIIFNLGI